MNTSDRSHDPASPPPPGERTTESLSSTRFLLQTRRQRDESSLAALHKLEEHRPVDVLVRRLEAPDGAGWFAAGLRCEPLTSLEQPTAALLDGRCTLEELKELRSRAKQLYKKGEDSGEQGERLRGLCAYFLAVSAELAHHSHFRSSLMWTELRDGLLELSSVLPERWAAMLHRAVEFGDRSGSP